MKRKIIIYSITFGFLYGIITGLLSAQSLAQPDFALMTVKTALFPVPRPEREFFSGLPSLFIPYFFILMLNGGFLRKDLARSGVFSFTRYQNRYVWYFGKSFIVMLAGILYPILYISGFSGVALIVGSRLDWMDAARLFTAYIVCSAPVFALALLSCNFLSIRYGTHIAIVIMMAVIMFFFISAFLLWNHTSIAAIWLYRLNPLSGFVAAWRDMPDAGFIQRGVAKGYNLKLGFIIQLIQSIGLLAAGWRFIRRMDIFSESEEG